MSENINWLQVVIDYGKRNPTKTFCDLFGYGAIDKFYTNVKLCELVLYNDGLRNNSNTYYYFLCNSFTFEFYNPNLKAKDGWTKVPDNVLLRLLTEGKEDLI